MFAHLFNFSPNKPGSFSLSELFAIFFQQTVIYFSIILLLVFFITVLLVKINVNQLKFKLLFNFIKYTNIIFVGLIFFLVLLKFILFL